MRLIIVESPTKSRTIKSFLGKEYTVTSSYGHIRDLPAKELGVDIEQGFQPKYVVPLKAQARVKALKEQSAKAELVILACDEDREGEAIAWHLTELLGLNGARPYQRIVFHEITKSAIEEALKNPRKIDIDLVDAQQARRILDRLVGYKLSPFLWKKVTRGLSAGRVQSVAVRLVVEREREIKKFVPQEYWSIAALLRRLKGQGSGLKDNEFEALLVKKDGKVIPKLGIKSKEEANKIVKDLKGAEYKVINIEKKEVRRNPLPPFTTSTLQQEAWKRFRFPAKFTMRLAQELYETGRITYHRTDSFNLSDLSLLAAKRFILANYGQEYWPGAVRKHKTKSKGAQEAHEAIRPTYVEQTPEKVRIKAKLDEKHDRLYDLIWRRFVACQMAQASFNSTVVEIEAGLKSKILYIFRANGQILKFDGFLKVYPMKFEEKELPPLEKNEFLKLVELRPSQHFTQPPARYTEATLIKALEQNGIGRPSTYAPIISTIQERNYVQKDEKRCLEPSELGFLVNDLLVEHFPKIVDIKFTAEMEGDLDKIAEGRVQWVPVVRAFYEPFAKTLEIKYKEISKMIVQTKEVCEKCGKPMLVRIGRFGKFLACSGFPECKNTKPLAGEERKTAAEIGTGRVPACQQEKCDKCGGLMVLKRSKYGQFFACSAYPQCKNIKNIKKTTGLKCPQCNEGDIIERKTRSGKKFWGCERYPECDYATWQRPKR